MMMYRFRLSAAAVASVSATTTTTTVSMTSSIYRRSQGRRYLSMGTRFWKGKGGGEGRFRRYNNTTTVRRGRQQQQQQPIEWTPENIGRLSVGTASILGLGGLCFYGAGLGEEAGALEYSHLWPSYIRNRVKRTFQYFGGGLVVTASAATALYTSGVANRFMIKSPLLFMGVTFAGTIASMVATTSIAYENVGAKHAAWLAFNTCMGLSLVPICAMGGPLLLRAAAYTGVTVGGLCAIAACAPNDKFLNMGGALSIGLGVMIVTSLGTFFLPASSAAIPFIHSLSLYGGTILFSGFVLYDVQKIILAAEQDQAVPYDPINHSIGIYMDTINLFIRIAQILQSSQGGKRK